MTKQQFNRAVAERVMGWTTYPDNDDPSNASKYCYYTPDGLLVDGLDFATDHNAAAMLRVRVGEFRRISEFIDALTAVVGSDWQMVGAGYTDMWDLLSATPAQTARAAYLAVTGEALEAVDE